MCIRDRKALVGQNTKQTLLASPFFQLDEIRSMDDASDESRPKGWGISGDTGHSSRQTVHSGGILYEVNEILTGQLQLGPSKQEVYADCVRASLLDVLKKMENPDHVLAASLEAGIASLEVAVRATESARGITVP